MDGDTPQWRESLRAKVAVETESWKWHSLGNEENRDLPLVLCDS